MGALSRLQVSHLTPRTTLRGKYFYFPYCMEEEVKKGRGRINDLRGRIWEPGFKYSLPELVLGAGVQNRCDAILY